MIKKTWTKLYSYYLKIFYKSIQLDNAFIDYRCEIESKSNITIGQKSILYKYVSLYKRNKGQFKMGSESHVAPYGYFLIDKYNITLGDAVVIAKNCSFFCVTNSIPINMSILYKDSYFEGDIYIGNNVFIGTNCVVLPNTIIEDDVVIAANSTIKGKLERGYLYGGNPVKKIRKVKDV
jgi:galactoside O-acetyltransferase